MSIVSYGLGPIGTTKSVFEPGAVRISDIKDVNLKVEVLGTGLKEPVIDTSLQLQVLDASIITPVLNAEGETPKV
jgi:hypothetical protein